MVSKRQSRLEGHRRKFMAVIDNTPECARAVRYAAMRAKNSGGGVVLIYVIADADFNQWIGVAEVMRQFNNAEAVKKVRVLSDEWLPDSEELTPTSKLKRRGIHAKHHDAIESLYA